MFTSVKALTLSPQQELRPSSVFTGGSNTKLIGKDSMVPKGVISLQGGEHGKYRVLSLFMFLNVGIRK